MYEYSVSEDNRIGISCGKKPETDPEVLLYIYNFVWGTQVKNSVNSGMNMDEIKAITFQTG